jgi:hypothetical protein
LNGKYTLKISCPKLVVDGELVRYEVSVTSEHLNTIKLFYELDKEHIKLVSDYADAALVGLLMPAMYYGEDIHLEGKVSENIYWNISFRLQKLLQIFIPSLSQINIYAKEIIARDESMQKGHECATGFSGGIDSFCALADYFYNPLCPKSSKVTMLTFNNVGSHWSGEKGHNLFLKRYNELLSITKNIGLPFVKIDSNLDEFYKNESGLRFIKTLVMRNASVALLLQKGVRKFLHSSSHFYKHIAVNSNVQPITRTEPFIFQLLSSCDTMEILSVGSEYKRVEKIEIVSNIKESYKNLDVCTTEGAGKKNCSACVKCLRTLTALDALGTLELYKESFDLKTYKQNKNKFLGKVLARNNEFTNEIYELALKKKFAFPAMSYLYGVYYRLRYLIKKR